LEAGVWGTIGELRGEAIEISVNPVINVFWDFPWGASPRGVYGGTPIEILHFFLLGFCLNAYNWSWMQVEEHCSRIRYRVSEFDDRFRVFNVRHVDNQIFTKHYGYGVKDLSQIEAKEWRCLLYQLIICIGTTDKFIPEINSRNKLQKAISLLLVYYDLVWDQDGHTPTDLEFIDRLTPILLQAYKDAFAGKHALVL